MWVETPCFSKTLSASKLAGVFGGNLMSSASSLKGAIGTAIAGIGAAPEAIAGFNKIPIPTVAAALRAFGFSFIGLGFSYDREKGLTPARPWTHNV